MDGEGVDFDELMSCLNSGDRPEAPIPTVEVMAPPSAPLPDLHLDEDVSCRINGSSYQLSYRNDRRLEPSWPSDSSCHRLPAHGADPRTRQATYRQLQLFRQRRNQEDHERQSVPSCAALCCLPGMPTFWLAGGMQWAPPVASMSCLPSGARLARNTCPGQYGFELALRVRHAGAYLPVGKSAPTLYCIPHSSDQVVTCEEDPNFYFK